MVVELRQHWGQNMATGKQEQLPQYRIFLDNLPVGFLGWNKGIVCLTRRLGPVECAAIEREVLDQTGNPAITVNPPVMPPGALEQEEEQFDDDDNP